jgi:DNA-binding response OmpR family regulator
VRAALVDRDPARQRDRVRYLELQGWDVTVLHRGTDLYPAPTGRPADVVVFADANAQDLSLVRDVRARRVAGADVAQRFVVLGVSDDSTAIACYEAGVDVTLPGGATPALVAAACNSLTVFRGSTVPTTSRVGDIVVDREAMSVTVAGMPIKASRREFDLLDHFTRAPSRVFSRKELAAAVWGNEHMGDPKHSRVVDAVVSRFNRKAQDAELPPIFATVRARGYRLNVDAHQSDVER